MDEVMLLNPAKIKQETLGNRCILTNQGFKMFNFLFFNWYNFKYWGRYFLGFNYETEKKDPAIEIRLLVACRLSNNIGFLFLEMMMDSYRAKNTCFWINLNSKNEYIKSIMLMKNSNFRMEESKLKIMSEEKGWLATLIKIKLLKRI